MMKEREGKTWNALEREEEGRGEAREGEGEEDIKKWEWVSKRVVEIDTWPTV